MFGLDSLFSLGTGLLGYFGAKDAAGDAEDRFNAQMGWSREQFDRNEALQREFAQNGIRWRVADAQAAGIHPLFAMGGGGASYSPSVTAGGDNFQDNSASYLANMGQDVGRAIKATMTRDERMGTELQAASLAKTQAETDYYKALTAKTTAQIGPPLPSSAVPLTGPGIDLSPAEKTFGLHGASQEPGVSPYTRWFQTGTGLISLPSKDSGMNEAEIDSPYALEHVIKNRVLPFFGNNISQLKPAEETWRRIWPDANDVQYDRWSSEWRPYYGPIWRGKMPPRDSSSVEPDGYGFNRRRAPGRAPREYSGPGTYYGSEGF